MFSRLILRSGYALSAVRKSQIQFSASFCSIANQKIETTSNTNKDQPIEMKNPFEKEKIKCILCTHNIEPSYKNVQLLSQFQSPYTGRIYGRHITGLCRNKQQQVELAIARAQNLGLMGYMTKESKFIKDPKLFNPERPQRPHKY